MTNIIALSDMTSKFKVTMDSSKEKAFFVHLPDKVVKFKQMKNNLYGMDPSDPKSFISKEEYNNKSVQFAGVDRNVEVSEVEDNLRFMSERQRKNAKLARKAFQALGTPTLDDFKAMLRILLQYYLHSTVFDYFRCCFINIPIISSNMQFLSKNEIILLFALLTFP